MKYNQAIRQAIKYKAIRDYPRGEDDRAHDGTLFPLHRPKWPLKFGADQTIFTIGSCFARNIEEALFDREVFVPTQTFGVPKGERKGRPNGILNEFTPGTIAQRILFALEGKSFPEETITPSGDLFADLLLPGGTDVTFERAVKRRKQIDAVYRHLVKSNVIIITLGYIESWFDEETKLYLNRPPSYAFGQKNASRFTFKRLGVFEAVQLLEKAFDELTKNDVKIIVTVSPVPLGTTFAPVDCVVANEYSKSVLRVCAERLADNPKVDYFPSYEIVRGGGLQSYNEDHIHVKDELVHQVTNYMISLYEGAADALTKIEPAPEPELQVNPA